MTDENMRGKVREQRQDKDKGEMEGNIDRELEKKRVKLGRNGRNEEREK